MSPENFVYWLQGFFELTDASDEVAEPFGLTIEQCEMIKSHLQLVFNKLTEAGAKVPLIYPTADYPQYPPNTIFYISDNTGKDLSPQINHGADTGKDIKYYTTSTAEKDELKKIEKLLSPLVDDEVTYSC